MSQESVRTKNGLMNIQVKWVTVIWVIIILFTLFTRFHHLGYKAFHHDESLYAKYIWNFFVGYGYEYDPMQHGPFMFHTSQITMFLFGCTDYTVRILPAVFGVMLVLLPIFFRHRLGEWGALAAGALFAVSPTVMYFSRFLRHDIFFGFFSALLVLGLSLTTSKRHDILRHRYRWYYLSALAMVILFCIKENAFVLAFTVCSYAVFYVIFDIFEARDSKERKSAMQVIRENIIRYPLLSKSLFFFALWGGFFIIYALGHVLISEKLGERWQTIVKVYWIFFFLVLGLFLSIFLLLAEKAKRLKQRQSDLMGEPGEDELEFKNDLADSEKAEGMEFPLKEEPGSSGDSLQESEPSDSEPEESADEQSGDEGSAEGREKEEEGASEEPDEKPDRHADDKTEGEDEDSVEQKPDVSLETESDSVDKPDTGFLDEEDFPKRKEPFLPLSWFEDGLEFTIGFGIFAAVFFLLYTTFFFNLKGFWTGIYVWFEYWFNQHSIKRIAGPFHYYSRLLWGYEFLPVATALFFIISGIIKRRFYLFGGLAIIWIAVMYLFGDKNIPHITHVYFTTQHLIYAVGVFVFGCLATYEFKRSKQPFTAFLVYWSMMSYLAYSYLQEKVPWLTLHIIIPLIFVSAIVIKGMLKYRRDKFYRIAGYVFLVAGLFYALHTAFLLNWHNESDPVEQMVYVQTSSDVKNLIDEVERIAYWRGEHENMRFVIQGTATWPFYWYFRDWPNILWTQEVTEENLPMVICDWEKRHDFRKKLGEGYTVRRYRLRHWWIPTRADLSDNWITAFKELWNWTLHRKKFKPEIYGSSDVAVFTKDEYSMYQWSVDIGEAPPKVVDKLPPEPVVEAMKLQPELVFGSFGKKNGQFNNPKAVTVDNDGNIYVADAENSRIQKFSPDGEFLISLGKQGAGPGEFNKPVGVDVDAEGYIYVADTWNHRVQKFSPEGEYLETYGKEGVYYAPKDILAHPNRNKYVVDTGFQRVHTIDRIGNETKVFGGKGSGVGDLFEPVGIALGMNDNVLVADTNNKRIEIFDQYGNFIKEFAVYGWEDFYTEPFVAMAPDGRYFVTDSRHNRIQIFSPEGEFISFWGEKGVEQGQFNWPIGIHIANDKIYVSDSLNARIQVFPLPGQVNQ